jgi:GTP cyclohydrolase II
LLTSADLAGDSARAARIRVDRACTELRRGRPLALTLPALAPHSGQTGGGWLLAAAVETLSESLMQQLLQAGAAPRLLLSAERLLALGLSSVGNVKSASSTSSTMAPPPLPQALPLSQRTTLATLQQLAGVAPGPGDRSLLGDAVASDATAASPATIPSTPSTTSAVAEAPAWSAALALCKRSHLIPALLLLRLNAEAGAALAAAQVLQLDPADVNSALPDRAAGLRRVSDAHVPLAAEEDCTLVLFREIDGDAEHVAIIVGRPPADAPVPVRLHSACLTGDLLGSLRCDCGPQLQRAVARLAETGGVLLYLAQEGRGTGLANKLRAYRLQDSGLDTLQADRHLGFREDERDFAAAAAMLQALGHTRIQLLTNNPQKIEALRQAGIDVVNRVAVHGPMTVHNERYMRTKQQAGHLAGDD